MNSVESTDANTEKQQQQVPSPAPGGPIESQPLPLQAPTESVESVSETEVCRICRDSAISSFKTLLFDICECKGSIGFVHEECLKMEAQVFDESNDRSLPAVDFCCAVCQQPLPQYQYRRTLVNHKCEFSISLLAAIYVLVGFCFHLLYHELTTPHLLTDFANFMVYVDLLTAESANLMLYAKELIQIINLELILEIPWIILSILEYILGAIAWYYSQILLWGLLAAGIHHLYLRWAPNPLKIESTQLRQMKNVKLKYGDLHSELRKDYCDLQLGTGIPVLLAFPLIILIYIRTSNVLVSRVATFCDQFLPEPDQISAKINTHFLMETLKGKNRLCLFTINQSFSYV